MRNSRLYILIGVIAIWGSQLSGAWAQSAFKMITRDRNFSASNYCIYPDSVQPELTDAPQGKKPFYISHYGRHGSRYLGNRKAYDLPHDILAKADSLGKLTPMGKRVLQELDEILEDSEGRWGDLTGVGKRQLRDIARRMMERFPQVFNGAARVDARSTTVNRCVMSMGTTVQQLAALNPHLQVTMEASKHDMWFMNHQDKYLRSIMQSPKAKTAYREFSLPRIKNHRLMHLLFNDTTFIEHGDDHEWLNYYLLKTALIQQNTHMGSRSELLEMFTYEEIHQFWQRENAWWYYTYGPSPLNGGEQPYTQRVLLRKMIEDADSCIKHKKPGVQLRFGHETVVLPLTCLLGINGFDMQIDDLEDLEDNGWWACLVFPMASNIQLVFYRENPKDMDVLVKVLLNERETRLPLPDDLAPYYRWKDFREYYLKKLDDYETLRRTSASALP